MTQPYSFVQMPVTVARPMVIVLFAPFSIAQKSWPETRRLKQTNAKPMTKRIFTSCFNYIITRV
jgi:hypothetical protein